MDQFFIKALIIIALALIAFAVVFPARGSRSTAVRRLLMLVFFAAAVFAVIFPEILSSLASFLGVGRGTDLLLYAFIVVFIGNLLTNSRHRRSMERELTALARSEAIRSVQAPLAQDD